MRTQVTYTISNEFGTREVSETIIGSLKHQLVKISETDCRPIAISENFNTLEILREGLSKKFNCVFRVLPYNYLNQKS